MNKRLVSVCLLIIVGLLHTELGLTNGALIKEWDKTFGGNATEGAYHIAQTSDGGYILVGYTESYAIGGTDVWLIKTDAEGNKEWDKTFGGDRWDCGTCVIQTADGGYAITGNKEPSAGVSDLWLIKTDAEGNEMWNKTFGGSKGETGNYIIQTSDGGYIIIGQTCSFGLDDSDIWLIKTDENGNKQWDKTFGGTGNEEGYAVTEASDGGYILVGYTAPYGQNDRYIYLIKTDNNGNKQWEQTFGGTDIQAKGLSVYRTSDGGYIITGSIYISSKGDSDLWLIKTDAEGNEMWNKTFGGNNGEAGNSVIQTSDGGYIITGYTYSYGAGQEDLWIIKTDAEGNETWSQTYGGAKWDCGTCVIQTADGSYVISGVTSSFGAGGLNVWLLKLGDENSETSPTIGFTTIGTFMGVTLLILPKLWKKKQQI
ncbi:MAG: hypothetical protein ACTSYD_07165 [Candidatus Heimdallarchaeaceae archaeon]